MRTLLLAFALAATSCTASGIDLQRDRAISIESPPQRRTVALPLEVSWTVSGPAPAHYALFFDRAPMAVGKDIRSLREEDDACRRRPGCPDDVWLRARDIYVTGDTTITIDALRDTRPPRRPQDREDHRLVIVPLDSKLRRTSEHAYTVVFFLDRKATP
jgi:hypothetical protein